MLGFVLAVAAATVVTVVDRGRTSRTSRKG